MTSRKALIRLFQSSYSDRNTKHAFQWTDLLLDWIQPLFTVDRMTKRRYRKSKWKVFRARLQIKWCIVFQCNWFAKYSLSNSRLTFIISPWISISFPSKIPDPDRQISGIWDPEKPTEGPSRGGGGLPYERGQDDGGNFWIKPLKETNLGVAPKKLWLHESRKSNKLKKYVFFIFLRVQP